jgi:hypothetical protein
VCVLLGTKTEMSGVKLISPKKSSLFSAFVPCRGSAKYLQGGIEEILGAVKENSGGAIDEVIVDELMRGSGCVIVRRISR